VVFRLLLSPARWPPYGRPETPRLLKVDYYMLHLHIKIRSGGCVAFSQNTDTDTGVGVVRCLRGRLITRVTACLTYVCVQGDIGLYIWSGSQGRRDHVLRLERPLRRLQRTVEHVAEGQEESRGLLKGVFDEVMGLYKNFTISEVGDRGGCQKTITPSSLS